MKRAVLLVATVLAMLLGLCAPTHAQAAGPSTVTPWIDLELDAIAAHSINPPRASRELAHVSRAMYLAALGGGPARDDAVAGAASTVLRYFHPDEAARIDALADELADTGSRAFTGGRVVGQVLVARAERDGADAVWTGTPPQGPGYWVPTSPGYVNPPLEPLAGTWRTWNLDSGSQFRPGPPPAYGSPAVRRRDERGLQGLADADRRAAADRRLLGRRSGDRDSAGPLERDRRRARA